MAACIGIVLLPAAARGGNGHRDDNVKPFVPSALRRAAAANPAGIFRVIIQGDAGYSTGEVAGDVQEERGDHPGKAKGTKRRFRSLVAVSADVTGRQLLELADRNELLAITADAVLKPADDPLAPPLTDPPPIPPTGPPPPVDPPPAPPPDVPPAAPPPADPPPVGPPPLPAPLAAPAPTAPPAISGTAASGETLTASNGTWDAAPTDPLTFAVQWQRCDAAAAACVDIAGETGGAYRAVAADIGSTLRITVTATGIGGSSTAVSLTTAVVTGPPPPSIVTAPTVRGTAAWRQTLSVNPGVWQTTALQPYRYQWQQCNATGAACADILAATGSDYHATAADVGATIRVLVTATDAGGTSTAPSPATAVVLAYANAQLWPYSLGVNGFWPSSPGTTVDPSAPAIAVVDSGVDSWAAGLGDRLVYRGIMTTLTPNTSGDGRGHGTFVAGIAAGAFTGFAGAAPSARIVSLDVMDDNGMAMTSDVIAAADWIATHKDEYGIRVANFSLISTTPTSLLYDPLDAAVERLWLAGVVVVTASGNYAVGGADSGVLYAPANDPFVITVGASDINGTPSAGDDTAAPWSAWGHTPDGFAKPELAAPGRYLVAGIPPRSTLALQMPERMVQPGFIQLSGTSFATAATSGVAAALLQQHPTWTPDQVKGALMASARQTSAAPGQLGVGAIDASAAAAVGDPANPNAALNSYVAADPATGARAFDSAAWRDTAMTDPAWSAVSWGVVSWGVVSWGVVSWGVNYWSTGAAAAERGEEVVAASAPTDGAGADFLPAGGYWVSPSGR